MLSFLELIDREPRVLCSSKSIPDVQGFSEQPQLAVISGFIHDLI